MIDRAREALDTAGQQKIGQTLDQSLEAANAAMGVDVEEKLLRQLTGTFLFFMGPPAEGQRDPQASLGFQASIADADAFEGAFETVIGMTLGEDATELVQIEGQDAYVYDTVGLAILPKNLLVCLGQPFSPTPSARSPGSARSYGRRHASRGRHRREPGRVLLQCFELTPSATSSSAISRQQRAPRLVERGREQGRILSIASSRHRHAAQRTVSTCASSRADRHGEAGRRRSSPAACFNGRSAAAPRRVSGTRSARARNR